jgi:hypothetical protein
MRGLAKPIFTEAYRLKNERLRNGRLWRKAVVDRFVYLRFCIGLIMCP